jgi:hypothetical protein
VNQRVFYTLNLAVFTGMLGVGLVIPFMPIYAKTLGATALSIGVFFASPDVLHADDRSVVGPSRPQMVYFRGVVAV